MSMDYYDSSLPRLRAADEFDVSRARSAERNKQRIDSLLRKRAGAAVLGLAALSAVSVEFVTPNTVNPALKTFAGKIGLYHEIGPTKDYSVRSGDTIWTIATKIDPNDTGQIVYDIEKLNHLKSDDISPSDILKIPKGS